MFDPFAIGYDKGLSDQQAPVRFSGQLVAHTNLQHGPTHAPASTHRLPRLPPLPPPPAEPPTATKSSAAHACPVATSPSTEPAEPPSSPPSAATPSASPARANVDLRLEREVLVREVLVREVPVRAVPSRAIPARPVKLTAFAEAFNLLNARNLSRLETRAFLLGTPANGVTPLIFQDAATVAAEGVSTPAFGTPTSSTGSLSRERLIALGFRLTF